MKFENEALNKIVGLIDETIKAHTDWTQRQNWEKPLIYANANDGTEYDWANNNRLCEFVYWHKNGSCAMRCLVEKSGDVEVHLYPDGEVTPAHSEVHKSALMEHEVEDLYQLLMKNAELLEYFKYNAPVQEIVKYKVEDRDIQNSDWGFEDGYFYAHPIVAGARVTFSTSCGNDEYFAGWLEYFGVDDYDEYKKKVIADMKPDYCKEPESLEHECRSWDDCLYWDNCPDDRAVMEHMDMIIPYDFGQHVAGDAEDFIDETEAGKALCQELADQINDYIEDYFGGEVTCVFVED